MRYSPKPVPIVYNEELRKVVEWLDDELRVIAATLNNPEIEVIRMSVLNNEPDKAQDGDTAYADGTNWNPGSGRGLYCRETGAWSKK